MDYSEFLKYFIGLFAIINPCGILPVFIDFTDNMPSGNRVKLNLVANLSVAVILLGSVFLGTAVLNWFSISLTSFRIAGGILIATMAFSMLKGNLKADAGTDTVSQYSYAIVPLSIPLLAGPGAISTVIAYSADSPLFVDKIALIAAIFALFVTSFCIFLSAEFIYKILRRIGISVITRIMGLIMMSLAVEFIVIGIKQEFPMIGG
ncbi:MAG: YchE family NAAT transporter [Succinivibrionaceae bacterium]|nr:YchE family NAAT transporter [Succinivibrionaceae bacterium]